MTTPAVISGMTALLAALGGLTVLAGWYLGLPSLNQLHPLLGTMSAPTAFCLALSGSALWLVRTSRAPRRQYLVGIGLAALTTLLALSSLGRVFFGWPISLDDWLLESALGSAFPGQMPVASALGFLFLGLALLLIDVEIRAARPSEFLAFGAALISILAIIAHAYGYLSFFEVPNRRPLAFHTVLLLLGLAIGVLHARPDRGLMRLATSPRPTGVMVRRLLPAATVLPSLTGWLVMEGQRAGWYPPLLSLAFFAVALVAMFSALVWRTAISMDRLDWKRLRAEERIRALNADLEQRVRDRTAELEAANRELEAFSYSVSHDLRSPLRAIDGFSQILLEDHGGALGEDGGAHLRRVRQATQRMGMLIDDLIGLARVTRAPLDRQRVDLSTLALAVVDDLQGRDPRPDVDVAIAPDVVVAADPALMRVVLDNLLGNAWKFTRGTAAPRIEFGAADGEDGARTCFVRDNGAGFDMRYAAKLFTPFQRLHRQDEFSGTGIGLATVRRIVQRHGGRIWAEGERDRGATVSFTLEQRP
jgi:signal transduction histidine kinase